MIASDGDSRVPPPARMGSDTTLAMLVDAGMAADMRALAVDPSPILRALSAFPTTLLHADVRPENLARDRDRIAFIDWARPCVGPPGLDLAYYLLMSHGPRPPADDTVATYRRHLNAALGTATIAPPVRRTTRRVHRLGLHHHGTHQGRPRARTPQTPPSRSRPHPMVGTASGQRTTTHRAGLRPLPHDMARGAAGALSPSGDLRIHVPSGGGGLRRSEGPRSRSGPR